VAFLKGFEKSQEQTGSEQVKDKPPGKKPGPGLSDYLAGEEKDFVRDLTPYLPQELVGGSVPYVAGTEEEAIWNAASQACGTEKVHYIYVIDGARVWYLACPSSSFASNPDSWCPLAAALPGGSEFWDKETVYLYEQEGQASALRWDPETGRMQVFLGAARTILPRVQSMDANFVTIDPKVADVVPWQSKSLKTEKLSRAVVRLLILSGLATNLIVAIVLVFNIISIGSINRNLHDVKAKTDQAALDLVRNAANVMQSDTIKHMVRVQELVDELSLINGYLVRYEVKGKKIDWEAIVPQAFADKVVSENSRSEVIGREEGDRARIKGHK
jgi:hypothetical protein